MKHKPGQIIDKLREAYIVLAQGASTAEAFRRSSASPMAIASELWTIRLSYRARLRVQQCRVIRTNMPVVRLNCRI